MGRPFLMRFSDGSAEELAITVEMNDALPVLSGGTFMLPVCCCIMSMGCLLAAAVACINPMAQQQVSASGHGLLLLFEE